MSTPVDNKVRKRAKQVPAAEMRDRIIAASRIKFSNAGYDEIGVRELAQAAGVDPAIVIRTCGSKQELFAAVADLTLGLEDAYDGPIEKFGYFLASHLVGKLDGDSGQQEADDFSLLMRSAASRTAGPILAEGLKTKFIEPLARLIGEPEAELRAALLTAVTLGFATMRVSLGSKILIDADRDQLAKRLGQVLQKCLEV